MMKNVFDRLFKWLVGFVKTSIRRKKERPKVKKMSIDIGEIHILTITVNINKK